MITNKKREKNISDKLTAQILRVSILMANSLAFSDQDLLLTNSLGMQEAEEGRTRGERTSSAAAEGETQILITIAQNLAASEWHQASRLAYAHRHTHTR